MYRPLTLLSQTNNSTLTPCLQPMISDLKANTLKWRRECENSRRKGYSFEEDYKLSETHRHQQKNSRFRARASSPDGRASTPDRIRSATNYQLSREEPSRPILETYSIPRSSQTELSLPQGPEVRETAYSHQRENVPSAPERDNLAQPPQSRREVEAVIARRLRERGQTSITREDFDRLIDEAMQRLQTTSISKDAVRTKR